MSYKIVIEPRAISDIQDAVDYYEAKREDLGAYFYQIVDEYIESIAMNPFFQIRYKDYHVLPVKIFPYIFLYYIDEKDKTVYILSVFNTSQNTTKYPK
jgi:toxin ParE1/3/4